MTFHQAAVLDLLRATPGVVVPMEHLCERIWPDAASPWHAQHSLMQVISALRLELEQTHSDGAIGTVPGQGYVWCRRATA